VASFTCQLYYAFFNSFSTETLFDSVNLTLYNITFTSLPIFVFALLEQERRKIILHKNSKRVQQCCGSGMFIPDPNVYSGSECFPSRIRIFSMPDPHQIIKVF
jgi:magnesium-transporting ATPase (P-type)